jgi:mannan endo-1,4-beta-mannosidase
VTLFSRAHAAPKRYWAVSIVALLFVCSYNILPTRAANTADPNAAAGTKNVLSFLYGQASRSTGHLISGQMLWRGSSGTALDYDALSRIFNSTGKYPGLLGINHTHLNQPDPTLYQFAIDYWNAGGLITSMFNANNEPVSWYKPNPVSLRELITPGSPTYAKYMAILDYAAGELETLSDAGVVVLFRPYAEMNADFSWVHGDPAAYIAFWQHLFDYFTNVKGLHNLLWVYAPWTGAGNYAAYYPGDAYVDVVGLDYYLSLNGPLDKAAGYDELTALGKPFALTEFGTYPSADYTLLIQGAKQNMPKMVYWMTWSAPYDISIQQQNAAAALSDPYVVNAPVSLSSPTTPRVSLPRHLPRVPRHTAGRE